MGWGGRVGEERRGFYALKENFHIKIFLIKGKNNENFKVDREVPSDGK